LERLINLHINQYEYLQHNYALLLTIPGVGPVVSRYMLIVSNHLDIMEMQQSMSRKGNCWDNAPTERFFRSLKHEQLNYEKFRTKEAAKLSNDVVAPAWVFCAKKPSATHLNKARYAYDHQSPNLPLGVKTNLLK
jgi:hypothetical protein